MQAPRCVAMLCLALCLCSVTAVRALAPQSVAGGFGSSLLEPAAPLQDAGTHDAFGFDSGDVNEDGLPDLVAYSLNLHAIAVFTNVGGGAFAAPGALWIPGGFPAELPRTRVVDVNADGHLDVLACTSYGLVSVLIGDGTGGFTTAGTSGGGASGGGFFDVADLDGDGFLDIVLLNGIPFPNPPSGVVRLLHGHGDGTFGSAQSLGITRKAGAILARDLDADGLQDIVYQEADSDTWITVMRGLGRGVFAPGISYVVSGDSVGDIAAADADSDGDLDIYKFSPTLGSIAILDGAGDGTLESGPIVPLLSISESGSLEVQDMDRDGVPDLIVSGGSIVQGVSTLQVQRMGLELPIGAAASFPDAAALLASDLDADGLTDLVVTNGNSTAAAVLANTLGPFIDIGYGQQGPVGTPELTVAGSAAPGGMLTLGTTGVAPGTAMWLLAGFDTAYVTIPTAPQQTALIVPFPELVLRLPTGPLPSVAWPSGIPAGVPIYLQALVLPPAGKKVASNAVVILAE
ncbi:MAG TPA: VCBS repeat-containing protein [Planctomycetota bacterium]|nr:VCBS repeat-containing protein [Planctomycetota bacterium]